MSDRQIVIKLDRNFWLTATKFILGLAALLLFGWILRYSGIIITPLILASLVSLILNPLVIFMERNGLPRGLAAAFLILLLLFILILLFRWLSPIVSVEISALMNGLENENARTLLQKLKQILMEEIPLLNDPDLAGAIVKRLETWIYTMLNKSFRLIPSLLHSVITLVLIPLMTFFLLKDGRKLKKQIIQNVPNRYFEMTLNLLYKVEKQLGSYIRGQFIVSLLVGTLWIIALRILDVPYYFFIGTIAGLANIIPYFGPILGALPAAVLIVINTGSFTPAISILVAYGAIRLVDDTLISPHVLGRSVSIHPLLVIIAVFIGGEMFGLLGLLICIPVTGIMKLLIQELHWSFQHYRLR